MFHIPFSFTSKGGNSSLVPVQPGLYVPAGQTLDITGGGLLAYESIIVEPTGTLRIRGTAGSWTEIYTSGICTINGTILCRAGIDGESTHSTGTFTRESQLGLGTLSYSITQMAGARGGSGRKSSDSWGEGGGAGGNQYDGMGGGGGGDGNTTTKGKAGGSGNGSGRGNGSNASGRNGAGGASNGGQGGGCGGGGGGYKGHHGKGLVLYSSQRIEGTGTINASGRNGFNGGSGYSGRGGSGGGGAGGSGGKIIICSPNNAFSGIITAAGGSRGSNGGGYTSGATTATAGQTGIIEIIQI